MQPNTTNPTSRRAMLAGAAALPALAAAPALATLAAVADPGLVAARAYVAAEKGWRVLADRYANLETALVDGGMTVPDAADHPQMLAVEADKDAAQEVIEDLLETLIATPATTMAGALAMVEALCVLTYFDYSEAKDVAEGLLETLRSINGKAVTL